MEQLSSASNIEKFFSECREIENLKREVDQRRYLEDLSEDFLFNNYFTFWSRHCSLTDQSLTPEDKVTILNLKLRFTNQNIL